MINILFRSLLISFLLVSCGKQEVEVKDSKHSIGGSSYNYVIVRLEFITDIKELCLDLNPLSDYDYDSVLRDKEVAQCTFDNLSVLDTGLLNDFQNDFCTKDDNYNNLSEEDKIKVDKICDSL